MPTADDFAALARSSPWRWSALRFTSGRYRDGAWQPVIRAWVRRPDALRVETADGAVLRAGFEPPAVGSRAVLAAPGDEPAQLREVPPPVFRPDGLVAGRPSRWEQPELDAPFFENYFWVAVLDPVELADGQDGPPLTVEDVAEVDHHGRPAWEAVVRTTPRYDPRCGCCPLLDSLDNARLEYESNGYPLPRPPEAYPERWRVRLDVGTGVCVLTEELLDLPRGNGHELRVEAVDEPMDDALFRQ
ncbi:hypothetical protein ACI797_12160 [Geodermatophilus sp. SYSU D00691]